MEQMHLGDLLLRAGLITNEELADALSLQKDSKNSLGDVLMKAGIVTEAQRIEAIQLQLGLEFFDLSKASVDPGMSHIFPEAMASEYHILPVRQEEDSLYLAMVDPLDFNAIKETQSISGLKIIPMIATSGAMDRAIQALYWSEHSTSPLGFVYSILERGVLERASDIHIEPREETLMIRMRIDGQMKNILTASKDLQTSTVSMLKDMASMDPDEVKIPQSGRANIKVRNSDINLRISTLPCTYGEKVAIRLLEKNSELLERTVIGLYGEDLDKFDKLAKIGTGALLFSGPAGSGKSSTLYTMVKELNQENVNLVMLEESPEYDIAGCNQMQINEKAGLTFAAGLRAILKQDADIIAIGEIKDAETAQVAMQAALTGHLVLSTVHTIDTLSTIDWLLDMGVEPHLISGALKAIIAQRLVRKICPHCKEEYKPTPEEMASMELPPNETLKFYRGAGCPFCYGTGYIGRTGVFEILIIDKVLIGAIRAGVPKEDLVAIIDRNEEFVSLKKSCRRLVLNGTTTLEEALKKIKEIL